MQESGYIKSSPATMDSARFIFDMLIGVSDNPQNAAEIMSIIMVRLWLSSAAANADIDKMLESFVRTVKLNIENNKGTLQ